MTAFVNGTARSSPAARTSSTDSLTAACGGTPSHEAELVGAEAQRREHRRVELARGPASERLDRVVERAHALHRAVGELHRERAVAVVEPGRSAAAGTPGPRTRPSSNTRRTTSKATRRALIAARRLPAGATLSYPSMSIVSTKSRVSSRPCRFCDGRAGSSQAAEELVGVMRRAPRAAPRGARRRATSSVRAGGPRAPDDQPAAPRPSPRAPMCGDERADPVRCSSSGGRDQSSSRSAGPDLLRVRGALVGLRLERRLRAAPRRAARRASRAARSYTAPASSSGPIGNARCAAIGPASSSAVVRWIVTPVSVSPAMIARSTGAAPRQRGSSDGWTFSQSRSSSSSVGIERAVRGDDDHAAPSPGNDGQPLGLLDRDPEPLGGLLRRRRAQLPAPPPRPVGPRDEQLDVVRRRRALRAPRRRAARSPRRPGASPAEDGCGRSSASACLRPSSVVRSIVRMPSRWSSSCWITRASSPSASTRTSSPAGVDRLDA